jgi:hypothetical protein
LIEEAWALGVDIPDCGLLEESVGSQLLVIGHLDLCGKHAEVFGSSKKGLTIGCGLCHRHNDPTQQQRRGEHHTPLLRYKMSVRGVRQLKELLIRYSDYDGSSTGIR